MKKLLLQMEPVDWILAVIFILLMAVVGWLFDQRFGWAVGLLLGAFLIYRARLKRIQWKLQEEGKTSLDPAKNKPTQP